MKKLNTPSYSVLIPRDKRIKSIQELYENVGNIQGSVSDNASESNPLVDKSYVDTKMPYTMWSGTQDEYDAITKKDANTIYLIKES
jgi:hypothetical protein